MVRAAAYILVALASIGLASPGRAYACELVGLVPHMIDDALLGVDRTAPTLPKPMVAQLSRHDGTGCMARDSCGDFTAVNITNLATDDMTDPSRIGYRMTVIAGTLPATFRLPVGVVTGLLPDGSLWLNWSGIADDVDFALELVAVDAAGNESAPQTVRIRDDTGACGVARRGVVDGGTVAMALLALMWARRGRSSRAGSQQRDDG